MKRIICIFILILSNFYCIAQTDISDVIKYHSQMRMVVDINTSKQTKYSESSLIVMDFKQKTINIHPNQFTLDMVRLLPETKENDFTSINILCIDNKQKQCTVSTAYFKSGTIVIRVTYDDFDYVYNVMESK